MRIIERPRIDLLQFSFMSQDTSYSSELLAKKLIVRSNCPDIILAAGPCRSGTTAQIRVFAQNGIPAFFQPIKAILRHTMVDEELLFHIPNNKERIFIKETIGPYTDAESRINPLQILLEAGVPASKITFISMMREPLSDVSSWLEQFSFHTNKNTLIDNAIKAYQTVNEMKKEAQAFGIKNHSFVYESLRDNTAFTVISSMFNCLGIPLSTDVFKDWRTLPPMGTPESNITFPPESEQYKSSGGHLFHEKVEQSTGLHYYPKDSSKIDAVLTWNNIRKLEKNGLIDIYNQARAECVGQLGLAIRESTELKEFKIRHSIGERRDCLALQNDSFGTNRLFEGKTKKGKER